MKAAARKKHTHIFFDAANIGIDVVLQIKRRALSVCDRL